MNKATTDLKNKVIQVIDTLELHTITKPEDSSERAVIEAYKALYTLKDYFDAMITKEKLHQSNTK